MAIDPQRRQRSAAVPLGRKGSSLTLTLAFSDEQAWAFAQFLKRVCFSDYEPRATSQAEAYTMLGVGEQIREALREQGYAPR
jgi:hypothetical protein